MFRKKGPSEVEVARENEVKIGITNELSSTLKTVQRENVGTEEQAVYSTDTANNVCNCIEAIFLHGLKSKAVTKIASYVGLGQQATSQSALNFWDFVSQFTHGEVIAQLKHLGQIMTEIGLCRAWVRVALNDGIMESYVDAMVSDKKTLEYYYHRTAYLRDLEQPDIMKTYLQGLMHFELKLSYNASVLNEWSYPPLLLAGIIDMKDAPPPIIKPAVQKPKPAKSSRSARDSGNIVDVRQERSRSRGSSYNSDKIDSSYNPMEQPTFGPPSDSSYYVSSSEFTSKDVEEFKKLSRNATAAVSECSSSSHMSAPDPPQMNLSPASYVRKYGVQTGSPASDRKYGVQAWSPASDRNDPSGKDASVMRQKDRGIVDQVDVTDAIKSTTSKDTGVIASNNRPLVESVNVINASDFNTDGEDSGILQNPDLEESWEEFYKSPVKKSQDIDFNKFQRLDSINREAIISNILDTSSFDETDAMQTNPGELNEVVVENHERLQKTVDTSAIPEAGCLDSKIDEGGDTEGDAGQYDGSIAENLNEADTAATNELLNVSQKLLTELGIEGDCDTDLRSETNEEDSIVHEVISPSKGIKKSTKKSPADRLRPPLSPPKSDIVGPELSNAVAVEIDQIKSLDNPEYLSKHRLSFPYIASAPKADRSSHRKSLPDVLEQKSENDGSYDTPYTIEEHLYNGMPLDKTTDGPTGPPYNDNIKQDTSRPSCNDNNLEKINEADDTYDPSEEEITRHITNQLNSIGNSLTMTGRGWSSSFESDAGDTGDAFSPPRSNVTLPINRPKTESFGSLLQNYTPASSLSARSVDDILSNFPTRKDTFISPVQPRSPSTNEDTDNLEGFEVLRSSSTDPDSNDVSRMLQFSSIANEKGLDAQNFQCRGCSRAVGLIFGKPRVCKFDGGYYCYECHENDEYYIPALIIHNWDFRKHKVAKKNLEFLIDKEEQPYLNIDEINSRLYDHVQEMQEIQALRLQLILLKTYLYTCKQSIAEDLRRLVWPRDYLYENRELYSLADLLQVPTGALASSLRKVIKFATKHVYGCRLCSQKGFICELCNNPKVIYAFELEATYRCPQCMTVFHTHCKTDNRPCPKCERRMSRQMYQGTSVAMVTSDYDHQSSLE